MNGEIRTADGLRGFAVDGLPRGARAAFAARGPRGEGNLSLSGGRDRASALAARASWSRFLGIAAGDWVCAALEHGAVVRAAGEAERGRGALHPGSVLAPCDGLVTSTPGLPLYLPVADCGAVLLLRGGARPRLAALHAGWRGLAAGILREGVRRAREGGEEGAPLWAWIGPCARAPSYEVGAEVAALAPPAAVRRDGGRLSADVGVWCAEELAAAGVPRAAIRDCGLDTIADERLFSHRREGDGAGRNALIAVLAG